MTLRLVLISDIHDRPVAVPSGDVLILAGDIFCGDDAASLRSDLAWIKSLGFKTVLAVLGNHDLVLIRDDTAWYCFGVTITMIKGNEKIERNRRRFC